MKSRQNLGKRYRAARKAGRADEAARLLRRMAIPRRIGIPVKALE